MTTMMMMMSYGQIHNQAQQCDNLNKPSFGNKYYWILFRFVSKHCMGATMLWFKYEQNPMILIANRVYLNCHTAVPKDRPKYPGAHKAQLDFVSEMI
jgi:hypothetical protein